MKTVYFDHAATTPVDRQVLEAMLPYFSEHYGNPSELHRLGREARAAVEAARAQVAGVLGAGEKEIVFTAGGTESDNLALFGSLARYQPGHFIVSAIEHPAVMEAARALNRLGWAVDFVPVDGDGIVDLDAYEQAFRDDTGSRRSCSPTTWSARCSPSRRWRGSRTKGGPVPHRRRAGRRVPAGRRRRARRGHAQPLGPQALRPQGHRGSLREARHAPAAYPARGRARAPPALGHRDVPGIVGLGVALSLAVEQLPEVRPPSRVAARRLAAGVVERIPDVTYLGHPTERLPGNVAFSVRYVEGESMLLQLDSRGFVVSSGSACASGSLEPSHVVLALGLGAEDAHGSMRVSLGRENTVEEVDAFLEAFPPVVDKLRQMSPLYVKG